MCHGHAPLFVVLVEEVPPTHVVRKPLLNLGMFVLCFCMCVCLCVCPSHLVDGRAEVPDGTLHAMCLPSVCVHMFVCVCVSMCASVCERVCHGGGDALVVVHPVVLILRRRTVPNTHTHI